MLSITILAVLVAALSTTAFFLFAGPSGPLFTEQPGRSSEPLAPATAESTPAASVTETPQPNAPAPPARPPQGGEGPPPAAGAAAPGAPTAPARTVLSGEDLGEIRSPPEQTITALKVPEGFDSGDYAITFEIYGWGPGGKEGGRLVIHIIEAVPGTGVAGISDPSARNALVHIDASSAGAITQGGRYEARLAVREIEPGRGELYLEEVRPAR